MLPLVNGEFETLTPYVPGKPVSETERELGISGVIKLASTENPLGPRPKARDYEPQRGAQEKVRGHFPPLYQHRQDPLKLRLFGGKLCFKP